MSYIVYFIVDPRTRKIFYVGQTSDLEKRIESHLVRGKRKVGKRIDEILATGRAPQFVHVEKHEKRWQAVRAERQWIALLLEADSVLENKEVKEFRRNGSLPARYVPARAGRRWSNEEDEELMRQKDADWTDFAMARAAQRSVGAIRARLKHLDQDGNEPSVA